MATYDMDKKQEIVDYYIKNGLKATAKKFKMTEEQLMDDFYGIGQSERGDSQGGRNDMDDQRSFLKDMLLNALGIKKAQAMETGSMDGMFSTKDIKPNKKDYNYEPGKIDGADFNEFGMVEDDGSSGMEVSDAENDKAVTKKSDGKIDGKDYDEFGMKDEMIPIADKKVVTDNPIEDAGLIDGYDWNEFGRKSEDGTLEAEKEDTTAKEYEKAPKDVPEDDYNYDGSVEKKSKYPGFHRLPGQNFWTLNEKDPFWQTEEGGKAAEKEWGSRPSFVKQKEVEEFDFDGLLGRLGFK